MVIFILIGGFTVSAQELEWSNARKLKGAAVFTSIIGQNETGLYMLRYRNKFLTRSIVIERYRNQMGFALSKNITLKKSRLLYAELQDKGLLLVTASYDRKGLKNDVYGQWYDENINPISKPILLVSSPLADFYDKGDFRIRMSNNRKNLMIVHTERSDSNTRVLCINQFDQDLNSILQRKYALSLAYTNFFLTNILLDNSLNAYFLISQHPLGTRKDQVSKSTATVYTYMHDRDELSDYDILDTGVYLKKAQFTWDRSKNKVNLTAFYTDRKKQEMQGLFNFEYQLNTHSAKKTYQEFTEEFKAEIFGGNEGSLFSGIDDFDIKRVIPNTDGGLTIIAERSSVSNETDITYINGIPTTMSRNIYNFDDVLVLSLTANLSVRWKHVIHKSQSSLNDNGYYSSIVISSTRSHIYILYNDRLRTNGDVMQYTIDMDGKASNKILIRSDKHFVSIIPSEARQIGYNRVILPVTKDRRFSLLKLDYPN